MKRLLCLLFTLVFLGMTSLAFSQDGTEKDVKKADIAEKKSSGKEAAQEEQLLPRRDIKDLPVPYVMKLDKDNTYIMDVKGIKVGLLTYVGRVDGYSLAENIKTNFTEEKWKLQSMQNYKKTVSLSFTKDDRICNVFIEEGFFNTRLEIRVSIIGEK